jgi:hypothetical protein
VFLRTASGGQDNIDKPRVEYFPNVRAVIDFLDLSQHAAMNVSKFNEKDSDEFDNDNDSHTRKRKKDTSDTSDTDGNYKPRLRPRSSARLPQKSFEAVTPSEPVRKKPAGLLVVDKWKLGALCFAKRSSAIGTDYQVSIIPSAGTYLSETNESSDT